MYAESVEREKSINLALFIAFLVRSLWQVHQEQKEQSHKSRPREGKKNNENEKLSQ
jgi:hypothetical protein